MGAYFLRRLLGFIPTFFGITVLSFAVMHLAPGKPTDALTDLNVKISLQAKEKLIHLYGLDRPLHEQYLRWVDRTIRGDFGRSFKDGRPVTEKVMERIPITVLLNTAALALVLLLAIPIAVWSAEKQGSWMDHAFTGFVLIGFALPSFWAALLALDFFSVRLGWLPVSGLFSLEADRWPLPARFGDLVRHLVLPLAVMVLGSLAGISIYVRSGMVEVLRQDYIRTARAKGLAYRRILFRHALRNALLPLITLLGLSVPGLLGGSVILETMFSIPGMGRLFYDSVIARDYPVIMALLVLGAVLTLLGNLLADMAYAVADPRIRYGGGAQ